MSLSLTDKLRSFYSEDGINSQLINIVQQSEGVQLFLVGGYIRDLILDKPTMDRDYSVIGETGVSFARRVSDYFEGHYILLDEENDIARVVMSDKVTILDFSGCYNNNIIEDLGKRDFTVNAMAARLTIDESLILIDPYNAQEDIKNKTIRAIAEQNIIDDPLRILRAYRIGALLSAKIDPDTEELINRHYQLLNNVAMERIQAELIKLLSYENSYIYLKQMVEAGILEFIIPELKEVREVTPNIYHHLWLIDHVMEVYKQTEELINERTGKVKEHIEQNICPSVQKYTALKLAALLHDIGKPPTWKIDPDTDKHSFIGHSDIGMVMAEEILKRLKNPNVVVKAVSKLIKYHMYPSQLSQDYQMPAQKTLNRFFRKLGDQVPEAILLAIADRRSALGPMISNELVEANEKMLRNMLEEYFTEREKIETLPPLLNGYDVMTILGLKPSKTVGDLIKQIRMLQLEGEINSFDEAKEWLLQNYNS